MNLPAGLTDKNFEFFTKDGEVYAIHDGQSKLYEKFTEARIAIVDDMLQNISKVTLLMMEGYKGIELEKQWVSCLYGGFDSVPDFDVETGKRNAEYHDCAKRSSCPLSGKVCKMPEGKNGKLSHRDVEVLKAIATGKPDKTAADQLNVSFNSFRTYRKRLYTKIEAHSTADVMNFIHYNSIANPY